MRERPTTPGWEGATAAQLAETHHRATEAAKRLGCDPHYLRRRISGGKEDRFDAVVVRGEYWVDKAGLEAYLKSPRYLHDLHMSAEDFAEEYKHLSSINGEAWARRRLADVYGLNAESIYEKLRRAGIWPGALEREKLA